MCYGYSSWFEKARAKELHKAQERIDALNKRPAVPAPAAPSKESTKPTRETEKAPA